MPKTDETLLNTEAQQTEASGATETKPIVVDTQKMRIRELVRGVYDVQKLRISTGNRIVSSINVQLGQEPSKKKEEMDKEAQKLIGEMRKEYTRITDAYVEDRQKDKPGASGTGRMSASQINKIIERLRSDREAAETAEVEDSKKAKSSDVGVKYIRDALDFQMMESYMQLLKSEQIQIGVIQKEVEAHPMWDRFFKDVKGCGPMMAAVCIAYFDVHKARHVSSFYRYAGLDVVQVYDHDDENGMPVYRGEGRGRKAEHLEEREYINAKTGQPAIKKGLTYNPELKSKLLAVLGSSFLKTAKGEKYEKIYRDYRARLANRPDLKAEYTVDSKGNRVECDKNKVRRHYMANRYMVKAFVRDLWVSWRSYEGYEISEPYEVAKLGNKPHKYNEAHERMAIQTHHGEEGLSETGKQWIKDGMPIDDED